MAKIVENSKGFKVIEVPRIEVIDKMAKYGSVGICDCCGNSDTNGYYIAVLNRWYCPKCYQEWMERAKRYPEDISFEESHFQLYRKIFNV